MSPRTSAPEISESVIDEVIETRRHFHRHPEISFEEEQTSNYIKARLNSLGIQNLPCPTPTGAVGLLDTGRAGRTVMLRADIDALPILEESGVKFPSQVEGRMHACGHDAHMGIMLGVARTLAEQTEALVGRFIFVFQPAEEIVSGAREMIAKGLFDLVLPDVALGLHVFAPLPTGTVVTRPGLMWAGSDAFEITFHGPGGHGGMMGRTGNVISAQAFMIERLPGIVADLEQDGTRCHCTVGDVRSDGAWNIVPRSVRIRGSVRTFDPDLRATALTRLQALLNEAEAEFSVQPHLDLVHGTIPLRNDPNVVETVMEVGTRLIGSRASFMGRPLTVSDDMAEFLTRIPGCYFMLGAAPPDVATPAAHHSPSFRIDEGAFATGVAVLSGAAVTLSATPSEA